MAELTTSQNGHYIRKGTYSINAVLDQFIEPIHGKHKSPETEVDFDGDRIYMDSHRYWCFKEKGIMCCECGLEGQFFAKERVNSKHRKDEERYHFNMYGLDDNGVEVLFTKDHILPVAQGGRNHISNYATMCQRCNCEKGNMNADQWDVYKAFKGAFVHFETEQLKEHLRITVDTIRHMSKLLAEKGVSEPTKNDAYKKACILATALRRIVEAREAEEGASTIWLAPNLGLK